MRYEAINFLIKKRKFSNKPNLQKMLAAQYQRVLAVKQLCRQKSLNSYA